MKPWQTLATTTTSEGRQLSLHRHDEDFYIHLDGEELMSTRAPGSELALATLGCEHVATAERPRVLIGGLGLGFTLRAALDVLPPRAEVVVAELFPAVVEWNRSHLAHLQQGALTDKRVRVVQRDVWNLLNEEKSYDSVLLDVDNGPTAWCLDSNGRLYERRGIERLRRSLRGKGRVAVWASQPDPRFVTRMRKSGFDVKTKTIRTQGQGGNRRHVVILARL